MRAPVSADHPHARGENANVALLAGNKFGPSPRTWGELYKRVFFNVDNRTIPTHVGRTHNAPRLVFQFADHPHARGENDWLPSVIRYIRGPSPRTWGELKIKMPESDTTRTIPTHVGRTPLLRSGKAV